VAPEEAVPGMLGDFRILREVGRGGMGIVYEAEQVSLGRRVALKVLPFAATLDPKQLQRFHNEARAAACLHHEHIIPVYSVGCERGVHFYAMQFIDGHTLAQFIHALRPTDDPAQVDANATQDYRPAGDAPTTPVAALSTERSGPRGRGYYRQAAELIAQAAEALEHAHSLGIVHRDIKPANLLVGPGGKLWVGDFGLARLGADAGLTMSGDLLGTLRYMAPEQALARHGLVDHRADVYGLGATLYELLTLRPAVTGTERAEVLRQVAFEEPVPPRKLDKGIPAELETITLKCLAKNPSERYPAASELAEDLRRWLEDRAIKARPPTLRQRAVKWARRHRPVVGAAAVVLLLVLAAAGAFGWWYARQRAATELQVELAFQEAMILQGESKWAEALAAVRRAEVLLDGSGGSGPLRRRTRALRRDLEIISACDEIRLHATARWIREGGGADVTRLDLDRVNVEYRKAFQTYGIDVEAQDPAQAVELVRAQAIRRELIAALDHWAHLLTGSDAKKETWKQLLRVARLADADDWRNQVRLAVEQGDADALKTLARAEQVQTLPPSTLGLFAAALRWLGAKREALALLREAQRRHPGDYWINHDLARLYQPVPLSEKGDEPVRFYTAALAARPQSLDACDNLAWALMYNGRLDEAIRMHREVVRLKPDYAHAHNVYGISLSRKGLLDEAIAEYQAVIRLQPGYAEAYTNLGVVLQSKGDLDGAIAAHQEAIRRGADPEAHYNLGNALRAKGDLDLAVAAYRAAIRFKPDYVNAHIKLGNALQAKGDLDGAVAACRAATACRKAIRLQPGYAEEHHGEQRPPDATEGAALAELCLSAKSLPATAMRFYLESFAAQPALVEDIRAGHRYNAARAAARAGCGQGEDAGQLGAAERTQLRQQAFGWLRADLDGWRRLLEKGSEKDRPAVARQLRHWLAETDFDCVRGPDALDRLPEAERRDWQRLWREVRDLQQRADGLPKPAAPARP
jgi:tetratricopeptide (TPR) repeat protein